MSETKTFTAIPVDEFLRQVNEGVLDDDQPDVVVDDLLVWWGVRPFGSDDLQLIGSDVAHYSSGQFFVDDGDGNLSVNPDQVTAVMRLEGWKGFR